MQAIKLTEAESLMIDLMITTMNDELNDALVHSEEYSEYEFGEMRDMLSLMIKLRSGVDRSSKTVIKTEEKFAKYSALTESSRKVKENYVELKQSFISSKL